MVSNWLDSVQNSSPIINVLKDRRQIFTSEVYNPLDFKCTWPPSYFFTLWTSHSCKDGMSFAIRLCTSSKSQEISVVDCLDLLNLLSWVLFFYPIERVLARLFSVNIKTCFCVPIVPQNNWDWQGPPGYLSNKTSFATSDMI